jgi:hypothetical protein
MGPLSTLNSRHHHQSAKMIPIHIKYGFQYLYGPKGVVNTLLRGSVSPTSAHLLPQALRFSQSNVQHCYYCASQREHTSLSSVIMNVPFGATHTGSTGAPSVAATKTSTTVSKTNHIAGAKASSNLYQSDRTSVRGSRFGQPKNAQAVAFSN